MTTTANHTLYSIAYARADLIPLLQILSQFYHKNEIAFILTDYTWKVLTINREDELFIWVLKADLACIVYYQSQADTAAEADGPQGNIQGATRKFLGHFKNIIRIIQREICNRNLSLITYVSFYKHMRH